MGKGTGYCGNRGPDWQSAVWRMVHPPAALRRWAISHTADEPFAPRWARSSITASLSGPNQVQSGQTGTVSLKSGFGPGGLPVEHAQVVDFHGNFRYFQLEFIQRLGSGRSQFLRSVDLWQQARANRAWSDLQPHIHPRRLPVIRLAQDVRQTVAVEVGHSGLVEINTGGKNRLAEVSLPVAE
jgi:hypothetical protein